MPISLFWVSLHQSKILALGAFWNSVDADDIQVVIQVVPPGVYPERLCVKIIIMLLGIMHHAVLDRIQKLMFHLNLWKKVSHSQLPVVSLLRLNKANKKQKLCLSFSDRP